VVFCEGGCGTLAVLEGVRNGLGGGGIIELSCDFFDPFEAGSRRCGCIYVALL